MVAVFVVATAQPSFTAPLAVVSTFEVLRIVLAKPPLPPPGPTPICLTTIERIVEQFKDKVRIEGLICAIADRAQPILDALEDTKNFRSLDTAIGQQLDELGKFYRAPRNTKTDDAYRAFLKALAVVVGTRGRGDELLTTLVTLDNGFDLASIALIEHRPAALIMTAKVPIGGQLIGEEHASVLKRAVAGGVRLVLLFEESGAVLFSWSGEPGAGFAEGTDPSGTGGIWTEGV